MSSTERAPEPTMEEILASIRRIISEDELNAARQQAATPASHEEESLEVMDLEADNRIIDDIARVLSGSPPQGGDQAGDDDILDLTKELAGPAPVDMPTAVAAAPRPEPARFEETAPSFGADYRFEPAPPAAGSDETTSALERAIAALRAGQLPVPMPVREPEPLPELEPAPEPELVLTEYEAEVVVAAPEALNAAPEPEPSWSSEPPAWASRATPEPDTSAPRVNGATPHEPYFGNVPMDATGKTLEDSVKEMLRPLLRQWLDENMSRVLAAALQDELKDTESRRRQG